MPHASRSSRRSTRIRFPGSGSVTFLLGAALVLSGSAGASAQSVTVGSDRILVIDREKRFPIGLLELGIDRFPNDWNQRIRDSGANFVWDNGFAYSDSTPSCEAIRDSSLAAGYFLLTGSPDAWNWDDANTPGSEVSKPMYEADLLSAVDRCFPQWANHVGYSNRDEPVWTISRGIVGDIDSVHVHETYTQIRTAERSKVVAMNFANAHLSADLEQWKSDISGFLPATDIVMSANYPYPSGPGTCGPYNVFGPSCSMDRLWQAADIYRNELAPGKPLWMILQAHKGIPRKEARWTATQSIIHGATGLLWAGWTWFHALGDGMANWPTIREVISEFAGLEPVLVQAAVPDVVSREPNVDVLGKVDPEGERVVFAASRFGFTGEATIELGNVAGQWVEVLGESRWLSIGSGDTIRDHFAGYEAHIYRVQPLGFQPPPPPVDAPSAAAAPVTALRLDVFPNPARGVVSARLRAPAVDGAVVTVHDVRGRRVGEATLRAITPQSAEVMWDARSEAGAPAVPGLYFLRVRTPDGAATTSRVVLR